MGKPLVYNNINVNYTNDLYSFFLNTFFFNNFFCLRFIDQKESTSIIDEWITTEEDDLPSGSGNTNSDDNDDFLKLAFTKRFIF